MLGEKLLGTTETLLEQAPQTPPADFRTRAGEALDRAFWIFISRFFDACLDAHPIAHCVDFTERNTALHHAKRARVHAEENDLFRLAAETTQIKFMRRPGVVERVVAMRNWRGKIQLLNCSGELASGCDQRVGGIRGCAGV